MPHFIFILCPLFIPLSTQYQVNRYFSSADSDIAFHSTQDYFETERINKMTMSASQKELWVFCCREMLGDLWIGIKSRLSSTTNQRSSLVIPLAVYGQRAKCVAIVKHRTHQRGQLGYLYITSINLPDSITIAIHPPPSNDEKSIDLKFDPPVEDGFEVRQRLFEWRDKAFEHFDVVRFLPDLRGIC
jgi:hypothetical protein